MHEKRSDCVHGGFMSKVEDDQRPAHAPLSRPLPSRSDTFWAMCSGCKMEYEYLKTFLKHTLICVHCRQAFVALEAPPSSSVSRAGRSKRKRVHDHKSDTERRWEMGPSRFQMGSCDSFSAKELSEIQARNILVQKARREISKKMREWAAGCSDCTDTATVSMALGHGRIGKRFYAMTMSVSEPDIHDFDKHRTEKCFRENQVWAAYDNGDGMPRCYAIVHSVESLEPFRIRISWLNTKSRSTEMALVNWVCSGFMKTSGDFQVGRLADYDSLISFSHRVKWTKVGGGAIRIYPRKGEVWAVYRNWSPDWNELTPDEVIQKYDVVEVIMEDYEWDHRHGGVAVIPLVKVSGFKAVFHRHLGPNAVRMIPREELFRFSHQVPSVVLTGREAENAPKGCRELDPAATPLELLEVITVSEEEESIRTAELDQE